MFLINEAVGSIERDGKVFEFKRENIDRIAAVCGDRGPHAQIGVNMGTSIGYGEMKIDVSVTLTCNQIEGTMDEAARIAIDKAVEYINVGLEAHGMAKMPFEPGKLWADGVRPPAEGDRFAKLSTGRGPVGHVGVSTGTTIGMGEIKVKSNVRLACDQAGDKLDEAAVFAIEKSNEYTRWGLGIYKRS